MTKDASSGGHRLLFVASLGLGVPLLALCGLTLPGPPSPETIVFTLATLAFVIGGLAAPWAKAGAYIAQLAFLVLFGAVAYRFATAGRGVSVVDMTGPGGTEGRMIDRLLPERDVAIGGTGLLLALDMMPRHQPGVLDALRDGYTRMRQAEGPVPSPVLGTFLLGQTPEDHALLRIAPPRRFEPPEAVVVFLHGGMGSTTLLCWQIAQAAIPVGLDVVCPSTGPEAQWAEPDGLRTVEATLADLRAQGVRRIYLAGLSGGAIGVSRIAPRLELAGAILISGAAPGATPADVPTLVLQGRLDLMTPRGPARAYAEAGGARATYEEHPEAGHWMVLSHHEWVADHVRRWLSEREQLESVTDPTTAE